MDKQKMIEVLTHYNKWRRGEDESIPQPSPKDIGEAIDAVIAHLSTTEARDAQDAARYKFAFEHCYGLLDDIDTAGDIAKDDDKLYRQIVENTHSKRLKFSGSDGYTITIKPEAIDAAIAAKKAK